jgi:hypothetical protein
MTLRLPNPVYYVNEILRLLIEVFYRPQNNLITRQNCIIPPLATQFAGSFPTWLMEYLWVMVCKFSMEYLQDETELRRQRLIASSKHQAPCRMRYNCVKPNTRHCCWVLTFGECGIQAQETRQNPPLGFGRKRLVMFPCSHRIVLKPLLLEPLPAEKGRLGCASKGDDRPRFGD